MLIDNNSLKPYWFKVIEHFEQKHYFTNGLTIPFIIGSRILVEPDQKMQPIEELFYEFNCSFKPLTILKCGYLNTYVFSFLDTETKSYMQSSSKELYKKIDNFYIVDDSFSSLNTTADIVKELEIEYEKPFRKNTYSKNNIEWEKFTPIDIKRLKEV